ncbi:TPA: hypothetical protein ACQ39K_005008, partial [Yersinia enterocolitica]
SLPDSTAISRLRKGLEQGINGNNELLHAAITGFRDTFPTLSLWERFKDFFGLSDTADNRRDAATLGIISEFSRSDSRLNVNEYDRAALTLARILQDTGLAPECGYTELETLTADTLARLLARNTVPEGLIILTGQEMATNPETGDVFLTGRVEFLNAANMPELLRNLSLPFEAMAVSPLDWAAQLMGGEEDSTTLKTLLESLSQETRQQFELSEESHPALFSRDGALGERRYPGVQETSEPLPGLKGWSEPWVLTPEQ